MTHTTATSLPALPNVSVDLVRPNFDDIAQFDLPSGYRFRAYRSGDERTWTDIQRAAEPFLEIKDDLFARQYMKHADALPDRMFFVETADGDDVATISAWWKTGPETPDDPGRIHWVAVRPDHQRRGLSKPMMTHAMQRLAQSHARAMLDTSVPRIWAIKVYLDFGFEPDPDQIGDPAVLAAWQQLQDVLNHPLLTATLAHNS